MPALDVIRSTLKTAVDWRLFAEYGAVFATCATPPPTIRFRNAKEVERFQSSLSVRSEVIGGHRLTLQAAAMEALLRAVKDGERAGLTISPRAADAGARSYEDTVGLWLRNVNRGLDHWSEAGRLAPRRGEEIRLLSPPDQVEPILELEGAEELWFGTFFDKSILYSVAAPGASQHLSLLAFDVLEYEADDVRRVLNENGWFRTVPNDLPHFTYLGHRERELPSCGLRRVVRDYGDVQYSFWIPDI